MSQPQTAGTINVYEPDTPLPSTTLIVSVLPASALVNDDAVYWPVANEPLIEMVVGEIATLFSPSASVTLKDTVPDPCAFN